VSISGLTFMYSIKVPIFLYSTTSLEKGGKCGPAWALMLYKLKVRIDRSGRVIKPQTTTHPNIRLKGGATSKIRLPGFLRVLPRVLEFCSFAVLQGSFHFAA
jgi:hypothetical protein